MNASRIAFFAAFKPLRPGAENARARTDMNYGYMCRTQVDVKLNGSVVNFLDESPGNHLAMVSGDVVEKLIEVCDLLQIKPVMI